MKVLLNRQAMITKKVARIMITKKVAVIIKLRALTPLLIKERQKIIFKNPMAPPTQKAILHQKRVKRIKAQRICLKGKFVEIKNQKNEEGNICQMANISLFLSSMVHLLLIRYGAPFFRHGTPHSEINISNLE